MIYTESGGSYTAPVGDANTLVHGSSTWTLTFPSGEHWDYDANGILQKRTAADGQTITVSHDTNGQVSLVTAKNSAGATDATLTFTMDGNDEYLTDVTSSDGRSVSYNAVGGALSTATDVSNHTWNYYSDMFGRITKEVDPSGVPLVENVYDDNGRVYSQTVANGNLTTFTYYPENGTTTVTDASTNTSLTYTYDAEGNVTKVTDPSAGNAQIVYANGYPTSVTNRDHVTQTANYDSSGNLLWTRDPAHTNSSNTTDPSAGKTVYAYDSQNRVETETRPNGTVTTFCYTISGDCYGGTFTRPYKVTVTKAGGAQVSESSYTYDSAGRMETATDPDGIVTQYQNYTTSGQPQKVITGSKETDYTYYPDGSVHTIVDPMHNETDYTYDASGNLKTQTGPYASGETNPIKTVNVYDDAGRLVTTTGPAYENDASKPVTTNCYDVSGSSCYVSGTGQLMTVTGPADPGDANPPVTQYTYKPNGLPYQVTDPAGHVTTQHYGTLGRVDYSLDGANLKTTYGYDADGNQTAVGSPRGATTTTHYNTSGQVTSSVVAPTNTGDPSPGRTTTLGYDVFGRQNSTTDPAGATTTTDTFDAFSRPTQVTDARGGVTHTTYTPSGKTLTVTDPAGLVTTNCYDESGSACYVSGTGLLMSVTGPALASDPTPPVTTYQYNDDGQKIYQKNPSGNITQWIYYPSGKIKTTTAPDGVETDYTYDARGNESSESRKKNTDHLVYSTINYTYDFQNNLVKVVDADNHTTTYSYDGDGNRLNETDDLSQGANPAHYSHQWSYNGNSKLLTTTDGLGRVTTNNWDPTTGLLDSVDDPSDRTITYGYDFAGEMDSRQATQASASDPVVSYSYNADGHPIAAADPTVGTTSYSYDPAGDLIKAVEPGGRTTNFGYDTAGRRTSLTYPDGRSIGYSYDNTGHVASITPQDVLADTFTGNNGAPVDPVKWIYISGTTIQNNQATLALTPTRQSAQMLAFAPAAAEQSAAATYTFADDTNPQTFSVASRATTSGSYQVRITSNSSNAQIAKVDGSGNVTNLASFTVPVDTAAHRVRIQVQGNTIKARVWDAGTAEPTTWNATTTDTTYTAPGYVEILDTQTGTATTSVSIDNFTETNPTTPPASTSSYSYNPDGQLTGVALTGGANRTWHYTNGQLDSYTQTGIGIAVNDSLGYDSVGRLNNINSGATTYAYDLADQLTTEVNGSSSTTYGYDGDGRRHTLDQGSTHLIYTYDQASQLKSIDNGTTYTYDDAGRQLTATGPGFSNTSVYDKGGRLSTLTATSGSTTTNESRTYDGYNNLTGLADTTGAATTTSTMGWDPTSSAQQLLDDTRTNTNTTTDLAGLNNWDTTTTGGTTSPVGNDVYGSVISTAINTTTPACGTNYDAWGNPLTGATTTTTPCIGYRGNLSVNNLNYLHARNYDPATGTFTTTDPVTGTPGTDTATDPYPYANNNPIANTDPTGMFAIDDAGFWGLNQFGRPYCHGLNLIYCGPYGGGEPPSEPPAPTPNPNPKPKPEPVSQPQRKKNVSLMLHMGEEAAKQIATGRYGSYGKCGALSVDAIVISFHGAGCFMTHSGDSIYAVGTPAIGVGGLDASASVGSVWSNATSVESLRGHTACVSLGAAVWVAGVGAEMCFNSNIAGPDFNHVLSSGDVKPYLNGLWTAGINVSAGPSTPVYGSLTFGYTHIDKVVSCPNPLGNHAAGAVCRGAVRLALKPPNPAAPVPIP